MGCCDFEKPGVEGRVGGPGQGRDRRSLIDHPAVTSHGSGVDPKDLAAFILSLAALAAERVQGTGARQYGGDIQQFELKSESDLRLDIMEEAADIVAYGAMLAIKAANA
jgi:hypothetical protein